MVDWYELLCFGSPIVQLASHHVYARGLLLLRDAARNNDAGEQRRFSVCSVLKHNIAVTNVIFKALSALMRTQLYFYV